MSTAYDILWLHYSSKKLVDGLAFTTSLVEWRFWSLLLGSERVGSPRHGSEAFCGDATNGMEVIHRYEVGGPRSALISTCQEFSALQQGAGMKPFMAFASRDSMAMAAALLGMSDVMNGRLVSV